MFLSSQNLIVEIKIELEKTLVGLEETCNNLSPCGSGSTGFTCRFPDLEAPAALDSSCFSSAS